MKQITLLALLLISVTTIQAQDARPWDVYFSQMSTFEDMESEEWQDCYELLCELEEHPININNASWDDLQRIPFLNHQQIDDILSYILQYGGMRSSGELAMIKSIDYNTRCLLSFFIIKSSAFSELSGGISVLNMSFPLNDGKIGTQPYSVHLFIGSDFISEIFLLPYLTLKSSTL